MAERNLDREVFRVGLDSGLDPKGTGLVPGELAAVDLGRCLVRNPDILVVEQAADTLPVAQVARLRARMAGGSRCSPICRRAATSRPSTLFSLSRGDW